MEFINIADPAATQNTGLGLHCSPYCIRLYCIARLSVVFYFNVFFLLVVNSVIFTAHRNARIASAVLATAIPSVCLSVRPSVPSIPSGRSLRPVKK